MGHYDEFREEEYFQQREAERKRKAAKGKELLDALDMFRGCGFYGHVIEKEIELRAAILQEMYRDGALVINGD